MRSRATGATMLFVMVLAAGCAADGGTAADGTSAPNEAGLGDAVFEVRRDPG